jgi:hypothetical protein
MPDGMGKERRWRYDAPKPAHPRGVVMGSTI